MQLIRAIAVAIAALVAIPCESLVAQGLGLRCAVVPGSTEVLVSAGGPGWLVGLLLGEREGTFPLPGGAALGIEPMVLAQIGFPDTRGDWFATAQFPVGTAAGIDFVAQALAVDLSVGPSQPFAVRLSQVGNLRVPQIGATANLFILFGQSNAEGYANLHDLPASLRPPMPEARVWNDIAGSWQPLVPGANNTTLQHPDWCGPEITLAESLIGSGEVVYLFKFAVGQTALGPTPGPWNEWGAAANELYFELMRRLGNACLALEHDRLLPVVRGVCMMQGESDAVTAVLANQYETLLDTLVQRFRSDLVTLGVATTPPAPFVLGLINRDLIPTGFEFVDTVRAAQNAIAGARDMIGVVETTGLPLKPDNVHFATDGQITLGRRMAREVKRLAVARQPGDRSLGELRRDVIDSPPMTIWWILHIASAGLLLIGLVVVLLLPRQARHRRTARAVHGLGFLGLLGSGVGLLVAANMLDPASWPLWLTLEIVVWMLLGALPFALRRSEPPRRLGWLAFVVLVGVQVWLTVTRPFGG